MAGDGGPHNHIAISGPPEGSAERCIWANSWPSGICPLPGAAESNLGGDRELKEFLRTRRLGLG